VLVKKFPFDYFIKIIKNRIFDQAGDECENISDLFSSLSKGRSALDFNFAVKRMKINS